MCRAPFLLALVGAFVWLLLLSTARADEAEAERVFTQAIQKFQGGWYDKADKEFAEFLAGFPHSTNRHEAFLLQAQSRFQLKDYKGAATLLQNQLKTAGPLTDKYLFWLAETQFQQEQLERAAGTYAELVKGFTNSTLRLEASYGEAFARFRLGDTARTVALLQDSNGAFQQAARASTNRAVVIQGNFLLAEALLARKDLQAAEQTLTNLAKQGLEPETQLDQEYLLTRVEKERRSPQALQRVTNLVAMASAQSNALLQARSLTLQAEILKASDAEAASHAYEQITQIPGISAEQSRQALLKLVELAVTQNRLTKAIDKLDSYLKQHPQDAASDLLRLTLGEVYLKEFYALAPSPRSTNSPPPRPLSTSSNLLVAARNQFDLLISQFTNSQYVSKAQLDRGWCFWEEAQLAGDPTRPVESSKLVESHSAFQKGLSGLPKSVDNATARFKMADCSFRLKDYTNALGEYRLLVNEYADLPEAKEKLLGNAYYQIIQLCVELRDLPGAQSALDKLLHDFPASAWSEHALLFYGQALIGAGNLQGGRAAFADFEKRFPNSALLSIVRLADAKACAIQADWAGAIRLYDAWLARYPKSQDRPQAEFDRAWCYDQSGKDTYALPLFTNLVQQFSASPYAPLARLWVADYYLNQKKWQDADIEYQRLFQSTNSGPAWLSSHARLMAAKAAFFGQIYGNARAYLTELVNDPKSDSEVVPEAWFMLGDVQLVDPQNTTNKLAKFAEAINAFERVIRTTNRFVPLALGKMADCNFQLGPQDTNRYESAREQYAQVIKSPLADATTRCQAEVGLGHVLEKMAELRTNRVELLNQALDHYLNVVNWNQTGDGPDPFWLREAALAAGTLTVEQLHQFDQAELLYNQMLQTLPTWRSLWEARLASLRQKRLK